MDYAIQLFIPIIGGLMLGYWMNQHWGMSPLWMLVLAVLGMVGGIGIIYKRSVYPTSKPLPPDSSSRKGKGTVNDENLKKASQKDSDK